MRLTSALLTATLVVSIPASAQLLDDSFDYVVGSNLTDNGWTQIRSGTSCTVTAGSLLYPNYPMAEVGHSTHVEYGNHSVMRAFPLQNSGSVYIAFLINASEASLSSTSGLFFWVGATGTSIFTNEYRIKVNMDAFDQLRFGLVSGGGLNFTGYSYALNTTHLVVTKYSFNPGVGDDTLSLWIDPDLSSPESTPEVSLVVSTDASELAELVLSGETSSNEPPTATIDGVRVATSWEALAKPNGHIFSDDFETGSPLGWVVP